MDKELFTFHQEIDGKPLWVIDDLCTLQESSDIFTGLLTAGFIRTEIARPDTSKYQHWVVNLSAQQINALPVYQRSINAIQKLASKSYDAYRGYVNYATFGDMLFTHTDCAPDADELTVLTYISDEWDIEWGGETLFYNNKNDCVFACTPKPGRTVIFHGAIKHVGRPPNKVCIKPRYTLAFKMELAK